MIMGRIFEDGVVVQKDVLAAIKYFMAAASQITSAENQNLINSFDNQKIGMHHCTYSRACCARERMCLEKINRLITHVDRLDT